jgi:hypothetical protein
MALRRASRSPAAWSAVVSATADINRLRGFAASF